MLVNSPFVLRFADSTLCHVLTSKNTYKTSRPDGLLSFLNVHLTFNKSDLQTQKIRNLEKQDSVKTASHLILACKFWTHPNNVHNAYVKINIFLTGV